MKTIIEQQGDDLFIVTKLFESFEIVTEVNCDGNVQCLGICRPPNTFITLLGMD